MVGMGESIILMCGRSPPLYMKAVFFFLVFFVIAAQNKCPKDLKLKGHDEMRIITVAVAVKGRWYLKIVPPVPPKTTLKL